MLAYSLHWILETYTTPVKLPSVLITGDGLCFNDSRTKVWQSEPVIFTSSWLLRAWPLTHKSLLVSECILKGILYLNTTRKSVFNWYSRKGRAGATGTQFVQQLFSYNPTKIRFHIYMISALSHQPCFIYARMYALVHDGSYASCNTFLGGVQTQMIKKGPRSNRYTISTLHPQYMSGYQSHSTLTSLHTLKYQRLSHVGYSKIRWWRIPVM